MAPEFQGRVRPAVTASWSLRSSVTKDFRAGFAGGGCGGHPLLEVVAAAAGHHGGEGADVRGNGSQLRARLEDGLQLGLVCG
jgi:hypothetical protein